MSKDAEERMSEEEKGRDGRGAKVYAGDRRPLE